MGDLLWSLATVKAVKGEDPKGLIVSPYCEPLIPLLRAQPYLDSVTVDNLWDVEFSAPVKPWKAPGAPEGSIHLSMREWPGPTLGEYYPRLLEREYDIPRPEVKWGEPWFTVHKRSGGTPYILVSFTDEYAEIKAGWWGALLKAFEDDWTLLLSLAPDQRLGRDFTLCGAYAEHNVEKLASLVGNAALVIGDNSMIHPLSVGLGVKTLIAEPQRMRNQPVFRAPSGCKNVTYWGTEESPALNSFELVEHVRRLL